MTTKKLKKKRSFKHEKKHYTPFFQTIYLFVCYLFRVILKTMGVKFKALQMVLGSAKKLNQHIYVLSFKTKTRFFMLKFYIFTSFTSISHILLI
jgi:hypothetical protein